MNRIGSDRRGGFSRRAFLAGSFGSFLVALGFGKLFTGKKGDTVVSKTPVFFVGHGSPMNAIGENEFTKGWAASVQNLPQPKAILCVSAHWVTRGTHITAMDSPKTIHDFYGFPQELFDVRYPAPGDPELAKEISTVSKFQPLGLDYEWGLDHGTWSVLRHMYPKAEIPVLQLSIDATKPAGWHYEFAKELAPLRDQDVLIVGSGDLVHNLRLYNWRNENEIPDWSKEANETFKALILERDGKALSQYQNLGTAAQLAVPTPEHYIPMLYSLALASKNEEISFYNDKIQSTVSMTSFRIG
ncbi:aromatic ring-opening dioxygenase, catalytic subunit LigB [Leptospira inadai serovar Lyme str. 10]|uniref:Aromatic ring-opening dioxygenase, catalytic subunit LigB n=3 Tax=Leptospira inadai serovar Lyme TaxID=293084 RepID=V6HU89_9LEPT|nr:4,5-DOPA dioxygenase extradiol [Leptospira inadai]EQA36324.1 aromatic ring-opening dioxygenase, catalytic subunit LigB [Leptospira inadai serovar Lyme str. 10]PNV74466.1 4,5-DOPA dioxygenase extradiol [Leptospira inadai serovar Lyme]